MDHFFVVIDKNGFEVARASVLNHLEQYMVGFANRHIEIRYLGKSQEFGLRMEDIPSDDEVKEAAATKV